MTDLRSTRRAFLQTASRGLALATIGGCGRPPADRIVPYHDTPPELVPGRPLHYATALVCDGYATGVVVRCREGRPVKIEGNPEHPASLGGTTAHDQAAILDLYDPRRAGELRGDGTPRPWADLALTAAGTGDGTGLRLLLGPCTSPTTAGLLDALVARRPGVRVTFWDPSGVQQSARAAAMRMFGRPLAIRHDFRRARCILVLDGDPCERGPQQRRYAREIADGRRVQSATDRPARLWAVGPAPDGTATLADRRWPCRGVDVPVIAAAILGALRPELGVRVSLDTDAAAFVREAAADLAAHRGAATVFAGMRQPWAVHVIAAAIDEAIGAIDRVTHFAEPATIDAGGASQDLTTLVGEMHDGVVQTLVVAGVDPVYAAPADLGFADAFARVPTTIAWSLANDATASLARWFVPAVHDLERWGDARAFDGTTCILQPLLEPLWGGRTLDELLALFGHRPASAVELVHATWEQRWGAAWRTELDRSLQRGVVADSALSAVPAAIAATALAAALAEARAQPADGIEIAIDLDAKVHDGRHAANPWLQELPHPISKQTWGNAAFVAPALAQREGWTTGDIVEITSGDAAVRLPVVIVPGHAEQSITVTRGYGQPHLEYAAFASPGPWAAPAGPIGVSVQPLVRSDAPWYRTDVSVSATGTTAELAITQDHTDPHGRSYGVVATLAELHARGPGATAHLRGVLPHLALADRPVESPQWGMVVDPGVCTGCSACVVACQAENNVATVGFRDVRIGREMHWLRIDRWVVQGTSTTPAVVHQPMLCQHCELAPCEYVCPVNATVHSPDGLNEMVYNRCVGTRFCSNNCPYHVRRFNWFDYVVRDERALQKNPEVTVRERGVMEKCTYCVQRIRRAGIEAELEDRPLRDGDVVTACQQACPTGAIAFGDIADPDSEVSRWRRRPHRYSVLHELGTRPRTTYLAKIRAVDPPEAG